MGPTNVALVKLFQAEQRLRAAQQRLDSATRSVRIQQRKVNDLATKLHEAQTRLRQQQSHAANLDLDLKTRDQHIEKLRTQQQTAHTAKEYQAFLVEINTAKVDRGKAEDEALKAMEEAEKSQAEVAQLNNMLQTEQKRLEEMQQEIGPQTAELQAEIDRLQPIRDEAAGAVLSKPRDMFERLADRYDGEAMAAIDKPHRRREEYVCTACNMDLVTDIYNRLHVRDEPVPCPSCGRLLYIPDELPPELAVHKRKEKKEPKG